MRLSAAPLQGWVSWPPRANWRMHFERASSFPLNAEEMAVADEAGYFEAAGAPHDVGVLPVFVSPLLGWGPAVPSSSNRCVAPAAGLASALSIQSAFSNTTLPLAQQRVRSFFLSGRSRAPGTQQETGPSPNHIRWNPGREVAVSRTAKRTAERYPNELAITSPRRGNSPKGSGSTSAPERPAASVRNNKRFVVFAQVVDGPNSRLTCARHCEPDGHPDL